MPGVRFVPVTSNVEDPVPPDIVGGEKLAVAPVGKPLAARETLPLKLLCGATAILMLALPVAGIVTDVGLALRVKSGLTVMALGMIWIPFTGARSAPSELAVGAALMVNSVPAAKNFT